MMRRSLVLLGCVLFGIAPEVQGLVSSSSELALSRDAIAQIRRDRGAPDRTESHGGQAVPAPSEANQRRDRGAPRRTESHGGQVFTPPDIFAPDDTTRGPSSIQPSIFVAETCTTNPIRPKPLVPTNDTEQAYGLTIAEHPTLYAYIPPNRATSGFLTLLNADLEAVAQIPITVPTDGGIVSIDTSEAAPPLVLDEWYEWSITLVCDPIAGDHDPTIHKHPIQQNSAPALLMRIEPDQTLQDAQAQAEAKALPALFGKQGLWYDALAASLSYHSQAPEDEDWLPEWQQLLLDGNLDAVLEALDLMPEPAEQSLEPLLTPTTPAR